MLTSFKNKKIYFEIFLTRAARRPNSGVHPLPYPIDCPLDPATNTTPTHAPLAYPFTMFSKHDCILNSPDEWVTI